jgi:apolipoprotein D and lipocalin family protein
MKGIIITLSILLSLPLLNAQKGAHSKTTDVDINRLSGYWYQIAYLPAEDGKELKNVCIKFGKKDKEHIQRDVIGYNDKGRKVKMKNNLTYLGSGMFNDDEEGDMFVILSVDSKYQNMLIGSTDMQSLWVVSRTKEMSPKMYKKLLAKAGDLNYDVADVQLTSHK